MQVKLVGNRDKMIGKCFALLANSSISLAEVSTDPGGKTLKICVYALDTLTFGDIGHVFAYSLGLI